MVEEDLSQPCCAISGEAFERTYDPDTDKWYYEDAVVLSGEQAAAYGVMEGSIVKASSLAGLPPASAAALGGGQGLGATATSKATPAAATAAAGGRGGASAAGEVGGGGGAAAGPGGVLGAHVDGSVKITHVQQQPQQAQPHHQQQQHVVPQKRGAAGQGDEHAASGAGEPAEPGPANALAQAAELNKRPRVEGVAS